jgi:hypothetical protein
VIAVAGMWMVDSWKETIPKNRKLINLSYSFKEVAIRTPSFIKSRQSFKRSIRSCSSTGSMLVVTVVLPVRLLILFAYIY